MALQNSEGRLSKRDKLASYFSALTPAYHQNDYHTLDNEQGDYQAMHQSILHERHHSKVHRSQIQMHNVVHSRLLQLPTEVLLQIFKYLDKRDLFSLLTVCRDLSSLIVEIMWFRPNMQSDTAFQKIKDILELPRGLTHWDYRNYIKRLNLSFMTKFVDDELLDLFRGCPKLERLTLVNCTKLNHMPISRVLKNCNRLQSIDMTGVQDIQDDIIYALAQNCPRLQGLYAPGCGNISEEAIIQLLQSCPMLKRIKFNNSENISDRSILAMYENCKSLVEIDLHNCPNVTDTHLKRIFAELSQLREFRISNAAGITDDLFELIPDDCFLDKLRIIDVTGCNAITDKLVERMVRCAPRLRNVVLSKCMQIGDASLRHLTKLGRSLHYIHLGHCALVTDFGVQALVRNCHRIQYIDLACCSQLTDWTLIELSTLPKLRRIGLVKCNMITDSGIMELVRRRGEQDCLERVHLSYCTQLTIGPIFCLLKSCPRLTHLSLTGISAFLRREITQYCRDPPPDFTENQKSSFCVFSGQGVGKLRSYLASLMDQRAYMLEQYAYQNHMSAVTPIGAVRAPDGMVVEPSAMDANGLAITPSPPNETLGNPAFPSRPGTNGFTNLNEEEMQTWAQRRGLGQLRRTQVNQQNRFDTNESRFNETDAILRQLLTLEQQNRQRLATFHNAAQAFQPDPVANGLGIRPLMEPRLYQGPTFEEQDTEMDAVDLFPRTHDAQNGGH
ncbi:RNI-like protein [Metschnikowia bicuspidata var. bicuspidata NRRL YB-4993]|uniref:RNI-like protein n=1 Tax=Metschnikowia bicuspidata var. bicuspidata NRRL YB-4993 TaxID=869754 RepID=A0A1A0HGY8_9ASCO|nr:RNI-like protein [Metschnikowia bicuspidata var. bicuspidata NRRL YB-4993]OBA23261.1 RNI-like protein [Metschnikowia bicuspidata var. bicuspidata NRRL YB-4993]